MKIFTLTVVTETHDDFALVSTNLYGKSEDAITAYGLAVNTAKEKAQCFINAEEDDEVATDTPYKWYSIYDRDGGYDRITIELEAKEVL